MQPIRDFHFHHHGGLDTLVRCASPTEGILFSLELQSLDVAFKNEDEIKVFLEELEKENDFLSVPCLKDILVRYLKAEGEQ